MNTKYTMRYIVRACQGGVFGRATFPDGMVEILWPTGDVRSFDELGAPEPLLGGSQLTYEELHAVIDVLQRAASNMQYAAREMIGEEVDITDPIGM